MDFLRNTLGQIEGTFQRLLIILLVLAGLYLLFVMPITENAKSQADADAHSVRLQVTPAGGGESTNYSLTPAESEAAVACLLNAGADQAKIAACPGQASK